MKSSRLSFVIIIVLALVVGVLSYSYLSSAKTTIYLFNDNYSAGTEVDASLFVASEIDTNLILEAMARGDASYVTPDNVDEFMGDYLRSDVVAGTPFLTIHSDMQAGPGAEKRLSEGMVAVTVEADNLVGVTPFIIPDTYVNVYANYELEESQVTKLLLQKIRVIDVQYSEVFNESSDSPTISGITLEVEPGDSMLIQHAADFGSIRFGIVNGATYEEKNINDFIQEGVATPEEVEATDDEPVE